MVGQVKCPRCSTIVARPATGAPVCPNCGFGARAQPAPRAQPASGEPTAMPGPLTPRESARMQKPVRRHELSLASALVGVGLLIGVVTAFTDAKTALAPSGLIAFVGLAGLASLGGASSPRAAHGARMALWTLLPAQFTGLALLAWKPDSLETLYGYIALLGVHLLIVSVAVTLAFWHLGRLPARALAVTGMVLGLALAVTLAVHVDNNPFGLDGEGLELLLQTLLVGSFLALAATAFVSAALVRLRDGADAVPRWEAMQASPLGRFQLRMMLRRGQRHAAKSRSQA